jgi:hypothetical protein
MALERNRGSGRGIPTRAVESAVAILICALGALVVFDSLRLGAKWAEDGPQAGYFPFYIGAILCLCGGALLLLGRIRRGDVPAVFVAWPELQRVLRVLGPAVLYVAAIQLLGLYLASAAYIAFFMVRLGRYTVPLSAAVGAAVMAAFFLMFEVWFKVPLYKGILDPLGFLGY